MDTVRIEQGERMTVIESSGVRSPVAGGRRPAMVVYAALAWTLAGAVVVQVFLAGVGVLVDVQGWQVHRWGGRAIFTLAAVALVAALVARLPRRTVARMAHLLVLVTLQFVLVWLPADGALRWGRALHPVNALAIFWLALLLARDAWGRARTRT